MAENTITVRSTEVQQPDKGYKVALWDRDPRHEGGEVIIDDADAHEVVATAGVMAAISRGDLVETTRRGVPKDEEAKEELARKEEEAKLNAPPTGSEPSGTVDTNPRSGTESTTPKKTR
jgi:hypothetical protein